MTSHLALSSLNFVELHLTAEQEAQLSRIAHQAGKPAEQLITETASFFWKMTPTSGSPYSRIWQKQMGGLHPRVRNGRTLRKDDLQLDATTLDLIASPIHSKPRHKRPS
ncbi:hypothetical protein [Granulicella sp. dw_53]|uniref:hypothetical protein n=1 Tax=Granulicella sp. dw_53 TaxID=2719792 RepID=UPI001BD65031|nr:hypothetical protein [Granulicella sp. dw_53]